MQVSLKALYGKVQAKKGSHVARKVSFFDFLFHKELCVRSHFLYANRRTAPSTHQRPQESLHHAVIASQFSTKAVLGRSRRASSDLRTVSL